MKTRTGLVLVLAAVCCAALLGSYVQAQPPVSPSGGSPWGGGGPTFGFPGGATVSLTDVVRREDVRKHLALADDQVSQLDKLAAAQPEYRSQKMQELSQELQQHEDAEIGKILLPHQLKRCKELALQMRSLRRPKFQVAPELGLTEEQRAKADELEKEFTRKSTELAAQVMRMQRVRSAVNVLTDQVSQELGLEQDLMEKLLAKADQVAEEANRQRAALPVQLHDELLKILMPEQQAKWKDMVGEPFEFQAAAASTARPVDIDARTHDFFKRVVIKYDANNDGELTPNEWAAMSKNPEAADADHNGRITVQEYARWQVHR